MNRLPQRGFHLDRADARVMGVCAGLADYFNVDATLVRIGFVAATLLGVGAPILIYLLVGLIAD